jgi:hypothetical protein
LSILPNECTFVFTIICDVVNTVRKLHVAMYWVGPSHLSLSIIHFKCQPALGNLSYTPANQYIMKLKCIQKSSTFLKRYIVNPKLILRISMWKHYQSHKNKGIFDIVKEAKGTLFKYWWSWKNQSHNKY